MKYTLGTVCKLKGIDLEILIIGYNGKSSSNDYVYEYIGCLADEGFINSEKIYRFNSEHIDTVLYDGYKKNVNLVPTETVNNAPVMNEKKEETQPNSNNTQEEQYIFDENGVLVEIIRPEPKQEVAETQPVVQENTTPVTLQSIDINNI